MDRRRFLRYAATIPLATVVACRAPGRRKKQAASAKPASRHRACHVSPRDSGPGHVLQPMEWATLAAACDRLLPADEDPGATAAGVVGFIDEQMRHPVMAKHYPLLKRGIRFLHGAAKQRHKKRFAALSAETQDALIGELQVGRIGGRWGSGAFVLLHRLALEGFFCDPVYGGNKDSVGWKMIGFVPQSPRPRCPYEGRA